ncbi:Diadenylate cyclase (c-di-AMP synthetase), DisA-N domain [Methanonatronarchaeum thermophilum]|uniref:Diadenylate cyclase n=1 Tax=Methanonatronarchaeum thermophilum TaxID=1927129 RepID=A0A1Y3GBE8_9EURY|nr:diadenylate cyclase [Methanonatronarchaeum thermophilum]OUJ18739.1 Diadenylate cyclase (c-di-AMP synthetase), DisA-N domain [Methanonatronarchaeum thermophilum]
MEKEIINKSVEIANELGASALIVVVGDRDITGLLDDEYDFSVFIVTSHESKYSGEHEEFKITTEGGTQNFSRQLNEAVVHAYMKGKIEIGDTIIGVGSVNEDAVGMLVYKVSEHPIFESVSQGTSQVDTDIVKTVINLAVKIGSEGREGKAIGTGFIIGDIDNVLEKSHQILINPYKCQDDEVRDVRNHDNWENIKEISQVDGVFLIDDEGLIRSAGRYLDIHGKDIELKKGLGARHIACAGITKETDAIAVSVAKSGGVVRMFKDGEIIGEIEPTVRILPV